MPERMAPALKPFFHLFERMPKHFPSLTMFGRILFPLIHYHKKVSYYKRRLGRGVRLVESDQ